MPDLYDRIGRVLLARPLNGDFTRTSPISVVEVKDLRITFRVEKTLTPEPNHASIQVWNLAEQSRGEFQERPLKVTLLGGHNGDPRQIFRGDVFWSTSERQGPNWITNLEAGDGQRAIRQSRSNRSFRAGAKAIDAVREILQSMDLQLPAGAALFTELNQQYANGLVLSGPSRQQLTKILARNGLRWSIQDGNVQILREKSATTEAALPVNQTNGLIGSPEFGAPVHEGDPPTVFFRSILYPQLVPGRLVLITSKTANGAFRIDKVTHSGDTHGLDWTSEVECRSV